MASSFTAALQRAIASRKQSKSPYTKTNTFRAAVGCPFFLPFQVIFKGCGYPTFKNDLELAHKKLSPEGETMMDHKTKFLKARILLAMFSLLIGFAVATHICVQAEDYDIDWIGGTDNGSFDALTTTTKETGNSFYKFLMAVGVIGILCSVVICGVLIAVSQTAKKRS